MVSLLQSIRTACGTQPSLWSMDGGGGFSLGKQRPWGEPEHSSPLPHIPSLHGTDIVKHKQVEHIFTNNSVKSEYRNIWEII
jgi:hypothetical protein